MSGNSIWIPILIIGFVIVPYMLRPIRGEVLALREKEFVEAAVAQGAGPLRIMFGELLPNLWSTIIVFFTLNIANNMLLESALSFLGAGVRPPNSSWGTMVSLGSESIYTRRCWPSSPGVMILLTVLSLNVFGDGLRDALDPKSKLRLEARVAAVEPRGDRGLMGRFIARRLVGMVFVLFAVSVLVFLIFNVIPNSDPRATPGRQERDPAAWSRTSKRNGASTNRCRPVRCDDEEDLHRRTDLLRRARNVDRPDRRRHPRRPSRSASAPRSSGCSSGSCSATSRRSGPEAGSTAALTIVAVAGISIPVFLLATLFLYFLTYKTRTLPRQRLRPTRAKIPIQWAYHLILPWFTLAILYIGFYSRVLRSNMLDSMSEDYVRTARAKGLTERRV